MLDGVNLDITNILHHTGGTEKPPEQQDNSPKNILTDITIPLAVKTILFRNCTIIAKNVLQNRPNKYHFLVNGETNFTYLQQEDKNYLLNGVKTGINIQGSSLLFTELEMKHYDGGVKVAGILRLPQISNVKNFIDLPSNMDVLGGGETTFELQVNSLGLIDNYNFRVRLQDFLFAKEDFAVTAMKGSDVLLSLNGNSKKADIAIENAMVKQSEEFLLSTKGQFDFSRSHLTGTASILRTLHQDQITGQFEVKIEDNLEQSLEFSFSSPVLHATESVVLNNLEVNGVLKRKKDEYETIVDSSSAGIIYNDADLKANDLKFSGQLTYPFVTANSTTGSTKTIQQETALLSVNEIIYKGAQSGSLDVSFAQTAGGLDLSSRLTTPFNENFLLSCSTQLRLPSTATSQCQIKKFSFATSELPPFIELPETLEGSGELSGQANINFLDKTFDGTATIRLESGELTRGETTISGINVDLNLPNINRLQSSANQVLTFDTLESGQLKMTNGTIIFRVEDEQTLLLEKAELAWCGGKVETSSTTLSSTTNNLKTTLYCDRLGFTELLSQFGIEDTEGEGSLNGKLPIHFGPEGLSIEDGFLFSTPGNGGIIRFNNTEQLQQGIPNLKDTPYLDYTMKSLENFAYNWTKLTFLTEGEELLLTMQLDGKPEKPLPYGYRKGHIVPTDKGPGLQHPIRLDVNFRLPLQDLFHYGQNFQSILENM